MAWIVKPSATMKIDRRREPYVTDALKNKWTNETLPRYETGLGALMPVLHDVQHEYGYIPYQAQEEVAEFLGISPAEVFDCVSFYEEYHDHPVGKYVIGVCQSIACEFCGCGHEALLDHVRTKYGIEPHETTENGKFTLLALECLGSCDTGPVSLVNDELHENLTIEKFEKILESLA